MKKQRRSARVGVVVRTLAGEQSGIRTWYIGAMRKCSYIGSSWSTLALIASLASSATGCRKDPVVVDPAVIIESTATATHNTVTDIDGHVYATVTIGAQRWMAENLKVSHYNNGDPIPYVPVPGPWGQLTSGAWAIYNNDASYEVFYGKLYNWYTVTDPRGVCPAGWHVPSDEEWMDLELSIGVPLAELGHNGTRGSALDAGGKLKATALWSEPNTGANDSTGFTAYAGGSCGPTSAGVNAGFKGHWWTTTAIDTELVWSRALFHNNAGIYRMTAYKVAGSSIRCIEN